ncbi:hypothetical protein NPS01_37990 [Nocardioides psychrotolerans]|uniref:Uncharacterized protein n=1 Tax=Nocardioides psychrotolerans TaxID=1005945 RepID=A0A1I3I922_9ACTN|nr:hypothetical protein [Nocardioides psychrotolerans]GEP40136.1 hypothetical protein NPS01_37990 [Nocardioides psychrotolerans]SFI44431.1 hypothetical protein SAMN05216561_108168 [Nocardioides psychrotolerans]
MQRFETVGHARPVALVQPGTDLTAPLAPSVAVEANVTGTSPVSLSLVSGEVTLTGTYDGTLGLTVTTGSRTTRHQSRRSSHPEAPVTTVGLALTGTHLSVLTREGGAPDSGWTVRGRLDLLDRVDTRDEAWLAGLVHHVTGTVGEVRAGAFGQLGLRDLRVVSHADGSPWREDGPDGEHVLLTATSAGPGFFDTAHTSVWSLDPRTLALEHRSDLFFRRPDRPGVFGDHASHLLRDTRGDHSRWLLTTSTWGDFDKSAPDASVGVTLAETRVDLTRGRHVLDTRALALPTTGLRSVGVWDPHLVRTDEGWLVAYVSARRFFRFHPVLAGGPSLDDLTLLGAASDRRATEGPVLARLDGADGRWQVLASDGRDGRAGQRRRYPVLDLHPDLPADRRLAEVGALDAPYPANIPWPTLLEEDDGWLMIGFDGRPHGGRLVGYGSHGRVVFARAPR